MTSKEIRFNTIRSMLFVPALNDKYIASAHTRQAQAIILDLEDSITLDNKHAARQSLAGAVAKLHGHQLPVFVRVNNRNDYLRADLKAAVEAGADAVVIPKVQTAEELRLIDDWLTELERSNRMAPCSIRYLGLVETPLGMFNLREIVQASTRLVGLGFGSEDYAAALGVEPSVDAMTLPAQQLAMVARAFDLAALGTPGSIGNFEDEQAFYEQVLIAKSLGFTGASGIHPRQIQAINRAFAPTEAELQWARSVVQAYEDAREQGLGAVALDGKMIDVPIVERARRVLDSVRS